MDLGLSARGNGSHILFWPYFAELGQCFNDVSKNAHFLEKLCINAFPENLLHGYKELWRDRGFMDVTLACEDVQQIVAHTHALCLKAVLKLISSFLKRLLAKTNTNNTPLSVKTQERF